MLSSDPHFGHYTSVERGVMPYCNRPWPNKPGTPEMNADLIANYQEDVNDDDKFIFLGDMFFKTRTADIRKIMDQLPGEKILIRGNHDDRKSNKQWMQLGFSSVFRHMSWYDDRLGCNVVFNHDPVATICCPDDILLCGHVHQLWKVQGRCINVGVDVWNFRAIDYEKDIIPLAKTLLGIPYTDYKDNQHDLPARKKRLDLVRNAMPSAPHLGSISE